MEGFLGLIVVILLAVIPAIIKNKKREQAKRDAQGQEGQPAPRTVPMSDIQRAFMMAQTTPPKAPQQASSASAQAPPRPAYPPQQPAYTPAQATVYTSMESRMAAPMESRMAAPMEARSTAPMQARSNAPMEARSAAVVSPHPMYTVVQPSSGRKLPSDFYGGSMGDLTKEGTRDEEGSGLSLETVRTGNLQNVSEADLETITELDAPVQPVKTGSAAASRKRMPLRLFENKNELLKAVIYAEVLAPRPTGGRRA